MVYVGDVVVEVVVGNFGAVVEDDHDEDCCRESMA